MGLHGRVVVAALLVSVASGPASAQTTRRVQKNISVQSTSDGWTLRYTPRPYRSSSILIEGASYRLFSDPATPTASDSGLPQLPVETINLGIPFGGQVSVELSDPVYFDEPGQLVAPVPTSRIGANREAVLQYRVNAAAYADKRFYPAHQVWIDPPAEIRGQRVCAVHLAPYLYNPASRLLRYLKAGTVKVRVSGVTVTPVGTAKVGMTADPYFEGIFRAMLANYDQAKEWRNPLAVSSSNQSDPTRDWFSPGRIYVRIPIAVDGWYRVTSQDIAAAGISPSQIDTSTLALFSRGKSIPFVVRSDSSVGFYGVHNRGDSTYVDFYTDTSAYFLTWGGSPGTRYVDMAQPSGTPGSAVVEAQDTTHQEQNTDYYPGTTDDEIIQTGPVPGEGWVWEYYYPGTIINHAFQIDSLDRSVSSTATIRVRLFSTTTPTSIPNHLARFWMNDSSLGSLAFNARSEGMFSVTFPARWLQPGSNTLRIQSDPPAGGVNQFYLDWFEVAYPRLLRARNDLLAFTAPAMPGGQIVSYTVSGFTTSAIEVYDAASGRRLTGGSVSGSPSSGYTIVFQDTLSTNRKYIVLGAPGIQPVVSASKKIFGDLRANASGADYIIITHRDFLSSATQLASHRQSVNGVRTAVVDVQDIYDEFNYGVLNGEKLKAFLQYAYTHWPGTPPAYLLMLGDASWDYHHYLSTTTRTNYVPAYGVPSGDNWFGCFDSLHPVLPSLLIGRIPAQNPAQAQSAVAKIIQYDAVAPDEWTKRFLFISAGTTPSEQTSFDNISNGTVGYYITPPPLGGYTYKVYKTTPNTIDGENRQLLQHIVAGGVVCVNFLGHSGGRIWGMDIGNPNDLQNTNGRLPFVTSVSCNVGAFADPSGNVLSEDFVLADNRGAIGMWASSSLGYPDIGTVLVNLFFSEIVADSMREFGALTTSARYQLWLQASSDSRVIASVTLNPLLGDPLSKLVIPLKPDLAVTQDDISLSSAVPSARDTALTLSTVIHNYGLVPSDSVTISVNDVFNGATSPLLAGVKIAPTRFQDSLAIHWKGTTQAGLHTIQAIIDPFGLIAEVNRTNNTTSKDIYVYANTLSIVRPLRNAVVPPGAQLLRVAGPIGVDSASMSAVFELDTSATFASPALVSSGQTALGPVSAEWTTPSLADERVYFWRARTVSPSVQGAWTMSSFSTSSSAPSLPLVRWQESTTGQFSEDVLDRTSATDSGVTIGTSVPIRLYVRSLGYRADAGRDYYSILQAGAQTMAGLWWVNGSGFMGLKVDAFSGEATFKAFDVPGDPAQADSLANFINTAPVGNYIALTVIFDGRTFVSASLRTAIKSLGSTLIDSVQPGDSWSLIGRKGQSGPGITALEHWSPNGVTEDSLTILNYYSYGSGIFASIPMPMPQRLHIYRWSTSGVAGTTSARTALVGIRSNGVQDTIRVIPQDSTSVDLSSLNPVIADPAYIGIQPVALLATADALLTPVLRQWSMDFDPPADLAISARTLTAPKISFRKGTDLSVTLSVYNIGYRTADSGKVVLSLLGSDNSLTPLTEQRLDSLPVGGIQTLQIPFPTEGLGSRFTVQAKVEASSVEKDLLQENNTALYRFVTDGIEDRLSARVQLSSDGVPLMEGDYISAHPTIRVHLADLVNPLNSPPTIDLFVDNTQILTPAEGILSRESVAGSDPGSDAFFSPVLPPGPHELRVRVAQLGTLGVTDSVLSRLTVNVSDEYKILQMFNYPNPFARETWFTFVLTGDRPPEGLIIRIFTVAGRRVRELHAAPDNLQVGFNRVFWDGRDEQGDELANGYYFYKVELQGEGKSVTAIGKLVKVR
jgi:hypothetical protein